MNPPQRLISKRDSARYMNDNEIDALTDEYAKEDKSSTKTLSRVFVEKYLENVSSILIQVGMMSDFKNSRIIIAHSCILIYIFNICNRL